MQTSGRYLLDTNIVIALMHAGSDDGALEANLRQAEEVFVPAIVLGELFWGAVGSNRPAENAAKIERFADGRSIVPCDIHVAREYAVLKHQLKRKGRPIPENDVWIAAAALSHNLVLVTRDQHFSYVDGLTTTSWTAHP